jgi:tetratricopeptide (TPR) repeat protein
VVRVVDGEELPGRFVSHLAYGAYARAALLEADGDLNGAVHAYGEALREDTRSKEIWTRIGALRCRLGASGAWEAFDRAAQIDAEYEPVWRERAHCHAREKRLDRALASAERALTLDPSLEETSVLIANLQRQRGKPKDAQRWLEGLVAVAPTSVPGYEALLELAVQTGDERLRERAALQLARLSPRRLPDLIRLEPRLSLPARTDAALREGDLDQAQELALEAHMPKGRLAVRAAELGRADLAYEIAQRVLDADPRNGDAWVAALVAADRLRDEQAYGEVLKSRAPEMVAPSPEAAELLARLLERRVGSEASAALRASYGLPGGEARLAPAP